MKRIRQTPHIIPLFFLFILLSGILLPPVFPHPQTLPQQEDQKILKEKVIDLSEQVKERDEKLVLRRATIAKQRFMLISLLLFAALLTASLAAFRIREIARQKGLKFELIRTQQQALSLQMNPHFIFNTLGSLQSFILKNDRQNSNLYLTKFSQLMRLILENLEKEFVDLEEEIKGLRLYMELQHLRFGDHFGHEILIDPRIDLTSIRIPPFLVQPYVENSIHHGLLPRNIPGKLKVELKIWGEGILWVIEDDGIGRAETGKKKAREGEESRPHGTEITHRRIDLLNTVTPDHYSITTHDLKTSEGEASGTRVEIYIKSDIR